MKSRIPRLLGVDLPLVQAPLNWITSPQLIAAVSNAGGVGMLGPNAGPKQRPDGSRIPTEERVDIVLGQIRALTDKPFGMNIICDSDDATRAYARKNLEAAGRHGVKIFATVGRYDAEIFAAIKAIPGAVIIHRDLTPTPEGARTAEAGGADIIVATGHDEGGMMPLNHVGTFTIVPVIADAVSVPVMAAGGIADRRGVEAAFALGAEGVYVGTRFIASVECPAAMEVKERIVNASAADLIYVSDDQRSLPTRYARALNERLRSGESPDKLDAEIHRNGGVSPAMLYGRIDDGIISVGNGISLIHDILPAAEIVRQLIG